MDVVTLKNGAQAEILPNGQYRFVKGAPAAYLATIRTPLGATRGPNTRPSSRMPSQRFLMRKLKEEHGFSRNRVVQDMGRKRKNVLDLTLPSHRRIARKDGSSLRWDIQGLDHGNVNATGRKGIRMTKPDELKYPIHVYPTAPRSAAQLAASRRNIVRARAARV